MDFIFKGIPEHYRNTHRGQKEFEKAMKKLTNDEWIIILPKRTGKGTSNHISLNSRKASEIKQFLTTTAQ